MTTSKVLVVAVFLLSAVVLELVQAQQVPAGGAIYSPPAAASKIDCGVACGARCSETKRPNLCKRACGSCCNHCNCVPPGTSGNYEACPCYASLTTKGNRRKCP